MHLLGKKHRAKVAKLSGGSESTPVVAAAAATVATADPSLTAAATTGAVSSNNLKKKSLDEEEKFAHLNIAWDKYKIANQVISEPRPKNIGEEYEFYCSMCKKFMQRKMQLVDVRITLSTVKFCGHQFLFLNCYFIILFSLFEST